jgi:hypothetical protein
MLLKQGGPCHLLAHQQQMAHDVGASGATLLAQFDPTLKKPPPIFCCHGAGNSDYVPKLYIGNLINYILVIEKQLKDRASSDLDRIIGY